MSYRLAVTFSGCYMLFVALLSDQCLPASSFKYSNSFYMPSIDHFESVSFTSLISMLSYGTYCYATEKHFRLAHMDLPWYTQRLDTMVYLVICNGRTLSYFQLFRTISNVAMNKVVHASLCIHVQGSQVLSLIDTNNLPSLGTHTYEYLNIWMHSIRSAKIYPKEITSGKLGTRCGLGIMAEKDFTLTVIF